MKLISNTKVKVSELAELAEASFRSLVKAVVDVEKKVMVIDAELHSDEEQYLLETGSRQQNLWGINLHPDQFGTGYFIEYDSMINLRPTQGNRSRGVEDPDLRNLIANIVTDLVTHE